MIGEKEEKDLCEKTSKFSLHSKIFDLISFPLIFSCKETNPIILPMPFSIKAGKERRRRVWPVGAVSKTTTSNFMDFNNFKTSAKLIACETRQKKLTKEILLERKRKGTSSIPGIEPRISLNKAELWREEGRFSSRLTAGSISIAKRFVNPLTNVGSLCFLF